MRKFKLKPIVACVNTKHGLVRDHSMELKETDFPEGRVDKLIEGGFLIEIVKETKPEKEKVEKAKKPKK